MIILKNLRKIREERGLTQTQLAKILNVEKQTVSNWETGQKNPTLASIIDVLTILNVSFDHLIGNQTCNINDIKSNIRKLSPEQKTEIILKILDIIEKNS